MAVEDRHFTYSTLRELIVEHVFVGDVLRTLWRRGITDVEILRREFDAHGYDVVMSRGPVVRHVQLKTQAAGKVFLAQNAQLTSGPPIILIDDPIAHVDDLNALSFLDYLREISLTEKRQIFFATASDKLTTLFERKFDFLGAVRSLT